MKPIELDALISKKIMGKTLDVREVHSCHDCGWETDDLESSCRCQACWANGQRVTMGDKEEQYDFHPSTNNDDALKVAEKFFRYCIEKLAIPYGYEVTLWDKNGLSVSYISDTLPMAICKAALIFDVRV